MGGPIVKTEYMLDGSAFATLEEFSQHFSERVLGGYQWRGNLDAFNDVLRGGFGTPDDGFVLVWRDHALSRSRLGHAEMANRLERLRQTCHPSNVDRVDSELAAAHQSLGPTLFDLLVEIIREHGEGGSEAEDGVELVLA
jgi:hypothetical protein